MPGVVDVPGVVPVAPVPPIPVLLPLDEFPYGSCALPGTGGAVGVNCVVPLFLKVPGLVVDDPNPVLPGVLTPVPVPIWPAPFALPAPPGDAASSGVHPMSVANADAMITFFIVSHLWLLA